MIIIDSRDKRPIYEQIVEKMSDLMAMGALEADEKLPSVRILATDRRCQCRISSHSFNQ